MKPSEPPMYRPLAGTAAAVAASKFAPALPTLRTVPMTLVVSAASVATTGIEAWSLATTTGMLFALVLLPTVGAVEPSQLETLLRRNPARSVERPTRLPSVHKGSAALATAPSAPTLVAPGAALLLVLPPATVLVPLTTVVDPESMMTWPTTFVPAGSGSRWVTTMAVSVSAGSVLVALTVGLALTAIVTFGSMVGSMLPFLLKRLGFDPATASAPFVATLVDVTGLVIYFSVAYMMLRGTLL